MTRPGPGQPWRAPERLSAPINSTAAEFSPSISRNGLTLYFASAREGNIGSFGIWAATRVRGTDPWDAPRNLGPNVNTASGVTLAPFISDDGRTLYFMSARPESSGSSDCPSGVCFARFDLYASRCE
jgi:Tol biopolymer transport system component